MHVSLLCIQYSVLCGHKCADNGFTGKNKDLKVAYSTACFV